MDNRQGIHAAARKADHRLASGGTEHAFSPFAQLAVNNILRHLSARLGAKAQTQGAKLFRRQLIGEAFGHADRLSSSCGPDNQRPIALRYHGQEEK